MSEQCFSTRNWWLRLVNLKKISQKSKWYPFFGPALIPAHDLTMWHIFRCCTKVNDANQSDYRRESHVFSRATTGGNIIKSSRSGSKCTVNTDGSKTSTNSNDDKINLTPCVPIDKWYSLRLVFIGSLWQTSNNGFWLAEERANQNRFKNCTIMAGARKGRSNRFYKISFWLGKFKQKIYPAIGTLFSVSFHPVVPILHPLHSDNSTVWYWRNS